MSEQSTMQPSHEYQRFLQSLPADWGRKEVRQLGTVVGGGTPSREVPSFWRGTVPWVTPGEVSGNAIKFLQDANEHISASGLAGSGANLLPAGSLMVTTRATLGARAINAVPMATNQGFKSIVFKEAADAGFYLHLFEKVQPELVRRASGTTFLEISAAEFAGIEVPSPGPNEKRRIAQVLDTLDTAIHETEAIIAKLKAVKQGLLHDLLTRGIDANGELRPPRDEAPHLYKESPLGWIPKEWECVRLAEKLGVFGGKRLPAGHAYAEHPTAFKYLRVTDFFEREYTLDELENLHQRTFKALDRYEIRSGQLFISIAGSLGYVGVHRLDEDEGIRTILTENAARLVPLEKLAPEFVAAYMNSSMVQAQVTAEKGTGGGVPKLALFRIEQFLLGWPDEDEQVQILERLRTVGERIRNDVQFVGKLKVEKAGLMDDLLTGRVRVTPLLAEAEREKECA